MSNLDTGKFSVIGKDPARVEGFSKATGQARYCFDLELARVLQGKILRSPYPHARIRRIDTSRAEKMPGVKAVLTFQDVPDIRCGYGIQDQPFIARAIVRYIGEPVAAVAAETRNIAEEALDRIEVEYEELPAVFDPEEAMKPNPRVVVHEDFFQYEWAHMIPPLLERDRPNVCNHLKIRTGDVERGFKESDCIVENRFTTAMIQHCQMEPHCAVAQVESDGRITVWTSSQTPYLVRGQLCRVFGLPISQVRVIVPEQVGGGTGGRSI